ncbi:MAG TPA: SIR2 family protein [Candidatus Angelobacter sp.]|jgi:hypothetical protein|nr:SIR2 family protein [Candidatus Angelobacter sp.]
MCRAFAKTTPAFPEDFAKALISSRNYPEFFQMCRDTDSSLYNRTLLQQFSSPAIEPLYEQFVRRLKGISPIQIITTNVDLCLEQHLGVIDVIEKTDLERCEECIQAGVAFIGKLHGSISAIQSLVFTSADYKDLSQNSEYLAAVKSIFSVASVIFLGYGLQDEYVLKLIAKNETEHELYGSGPHFLVTSSPAPSENGVHRISYRIIQHADHRAALTVLDVISQTRATPLVESVPASQKNIEGTYKESGFYISDFRPSGTHISGQTVDLQKMENNGMKIRALLGLGFSQTELPNSETVAFHDFAVGLVCFDRVFLPLQLIGVLHQAIPGVFWQVIDSQAIKFVDIIHAPFFVSEPDNLMGDIGIFRDQLAQETETRSAMSVIRKILKPAPGMEEEGERRIETLGTHVVSFSDSERLGLPSMVRDALLLPRVSQLLGYSDYIGPNTIPRWLAYPTLRLAHLVQTALICDQLQIRASRVPFGGVSLLSAAFSVKPAEQSVYEYASFVLAGTYGSNLSTYIERNPHSLLSILKFRESTEGEALRREVSDRLETNEGTEFSAAIEGSLKRGIPAAIIQAARDKFSTLMTTANRNASATALWANSNTDDRSLRLWRERSKELLRIEAKAIGVKSDSLCLCGSGDRFRDCCLRPLN